MAKKFYAVRRGREVGIFTTWPACLRSVEGFMGARYKGFMTRDEAEAWLAGEETPRRAAPAAPKMDAPCEADYLIYTDGSCLVNPAGPGGWAAVVRDEKTEAVRELSGGEPSTTNNRMELTAAIRALAAIPAGASAVLHTDSQYMKNGFTRGWLARWKQNGWRTAAGGEVANRELWEALDREYSARRVELRWVKGHAGNTLNERCDQLAKAAASKAGR